jgi:hypothetical protein
MVTPVGSVASLTAVIAAAAVEARFTEKPAVSAARAG